MKPYLEILLPCGKKTLISEQDLWIKSVFPNWRACAERVRIRRYIKTEYGTATEDYLLHRLIMNHPKGFDIDHINRNPLDNRRENLRLASRSENSINKAKAKRTTSKYRGVAYKGYCNKKNPWTAYISKNNKRLDLGYFCTELEAAKAYDAEAKRLHGEFAMLNLGNA